MSMAGKYVQLDAFGSHVFIADLLRDKPPRLAPEATPLPDASLTRAEFVRRTMKEYYDAMRSEASCRTRAKAETLTEDERSELRDQAERHALRAANATALLTLHTMYPEIP